MLHARSLLLLAPVLVCLGCSPAPQPEAQRRAPIDEPLPAMKSFGVAPVMQPTRANPDIARDILELTFTMESGRPVPVLSRFEGPVTVTMTGQVPGSAGPDLARLLARLRSEAGIDIASASAGQAASITVEFLSRGALQATVPDAACFVVPRISSWAEFRSARRSALVDWTTLTSREQVTVFIPNDTSPQEIRDCLHEEIAQALGPLNDLYRVTDTVFNDDNFNTVLTGFDMLVLRAFYAPDLHSGMSRDQVAARLPGLLSRLNPGGAHPSAGAPGETPRAWISTLEAALGPKGALPIRAAAAERAVLMARAAGWHDSRLAFSLFAFGRLTQASETEAAVKAFIEAGEIYRALPGTQLQAAHVDMQLAAFALSAGQPENALFLASRGLIPVAEAENAALLATLLMIKAEALQELGRDSEAREARLDSLGWARYGFGPDSQVRDRMSEIASLAP